LHSPDDRYPDAAAAAGAAQRHDGADRGDRAGNRGHLCAEPASAAVGKLGLILTNLQWEARVGAGVVCPNAALKS